MGLSRRLLAAFALVLILFGVLLIADGVKAVHTGTYIDGCARIVVVDTVTGGNRGFTLSTSTNPTATSCGTVAPIFDYAPAATATLTYREGVGGITPPPTPDTVIIEVRDDDTNTVIIQLHNGAPPADGTTFSFTFTSNGDGTGNDKRGTVRIYMRVIDDPALTLNDYDCDSDGAETVGATKDCTVKQAGGLRASTIVDSITANAYPAGDQFAFGTAGNEQVTCTASGFASVYAIRSYQDHRVRIVRGSDQSVIHDGGFEDAGNPTNLATTDTIDNSYDAGRTTYGCDYTVQGNSPLSGKLWTIMAPQASHGAGVTRLSDSQVWDSDVFDANPNVFWDADGVAPADGGLGTATPTPANRGETVTVLGQLLNARGEGLTRSLTVRVRDAATNAVEHSMADTGLTYGFAYLVLTGHNAAHDETGTGKHLTASTTGLTEVFTNSTFWFVSSLYHVDAHIQNGTTRPIALVKDDFPTDDATENDTYRAGLDFLAGWAHVVGVRFQDIDTSGNAVECVVSNEEFAVRKNAADGDKDTGADGWTPLCADLGPGAPLGFWNMTANATFNGNSGQDREMFEVVLPGNVTGPEVDVQTAFEVETGFTAQELAFMGAIAIAGIILWHRSTDFVVRVFGSVLVMIPGFILLALFGLWTLATPLAITFFSVAGYLIVRMGYDQLAEGRL